MKIFAEDTVVEVWKPIDCYEGYYEVSSLGRVRSLDRTRPNGRYMGRVQRIRGKIISKRVIDPDKNRYYAVCLCQPGCKQRTVKVGRLVAQAFIPNPDCFPQVNHKDEDSLNDHVSNLEWCTQRYNNNYGTANYRRGITHRENGVLGKSVAQLDSNGNIVQTFVSIQDASRQLGITPDTIRRSCYNKHKIKTNVNGFKFAFLQN